MVYGQKQHRFKQLCLYCGPFDRNKRFVRKYGCSLFDSVNVALKLKISQILQKLFAELIFRAKIVNIFLVKMELFQKFDHFRKTCGNCITAVIGDFSEIKVKARLHILFAGKQVTVAHGQFIKIAK